MPTLSEGPRLPPPFPLFLLVRDPFRVRAERAGQKLVAELDGAVLEVDSVVGPVEGVVGQHLEEREMTGTAADLGDVGEPKARLADDQRVRRGRQGAARDPRLEIVDARLGEEHVIPPPGDDRVSPHARVAAILEELVVEVAHLVGRIRSGERRGPEERVRGARVLLAPLVVPEGPERRAAARARLPSEPRGMEELEVVLGSVHRSPGVDGPV
jgi:hypothetical protein